MPLPTITELNTALAENADYDEANDLAKGKAFRTACRQALVLRPKETSRGSQGDKLVFDPETFQRELDRVDAWVKAMEKVEAATSVTNVGNFASMSGSRC